MRGMREFGNALIVAIVSIGLMLGALSISLVEFAPQVSPSPTVILFPSPIPVTATSTFPATLTTEPGQITPSPTSTMIAAAASSCQPPQGWVPITIQTSDTLEGLAARYRVGTGALRSANCLLSDHLPAGTTFYVPAAPTSTKVVCNPGAVGWSRSYTVQPGDTLYRIATSHYTAANLMRDVNCRTGDAIYPGEILWVPNLATRTPIPTALPGTTVTPHPTDPLTQTALPFTATVLPSDTPAPATETSIPTPTAQPTTTPSPTAFP